jgi:hypothetical protein
MRRNAVVDSALIVVFAVLLILPLFRLNYMDNWPSIESTFISDSRLLNEHMPHPGWQPLWYGGTRFDYIYPPALRYGTALIARIGGTTTAHAYHLYTAAFYVFGFLAIYWFVRIGSGSRWAALFASAGTALLSPSFHFLSAVRNDSAFRVPQRLHVLAGYGEGPHITALCILPGALAAAFLALRGRHRTALAIAAVLCALTVSNNFYGATSLAILFPLLAWAVWNGDRDWRVVPRAASIVLLAAGLCAFWLTPSYLHITLVNMRWVSNPGNARSMIAAGVLMGLFVIASMRFAGGRPARAWTVFTLGAAAFLCLDVIGFYAFGFRIMGEPARFVPELDLAIILAVVEIARLAWTRPAWRWAIAAFAVLAFAPSALYLRHAWTPFPKAGPIENEYSYQTTKWLHENVPDERVMAAGEVRLWFNAWFNNSQLDGGSMQGMLNQILPVATYQILAGEKAELAVLWLQALGTGVVVVPGHNSREHYKDFSHPEKFRGVLPVLFEDQGTTIYRVPRVSTDIGRVVGRSALRAVGPIRGGDDAVRLAKYVSVVEDATQPKVEVKWRDFDHLQIQAQVGAGQTVLLQETYDPSWRASENGQPLAVELEPTMGLMLIDVPAGQHTISMHFETPLENRLGQVLFFISVAIIGLLLFRRSSRGHAGRVASPTVLL